MNKDCSKTEVFLSEWSRMCLSHTTSCYKCELYKQDICANGKAIAQVLGKGNLEPNGFVDIIQKWSDEHPEYTMSDKFFEIFPNGAKLKRNNEVRPLGCPVQYGWLDKCDLSLTCFECWNKPYKEVEE